MAGNSSAVAVEMTMGDEWDILEVQHETLTCTICLEKSEQSEFRVLSCGHYFCKICIEEWAEQCRASDAQLRCPMDRNVVDMHNCTEPLKYVGDIYWMDECDEDSGIAIDPLLHGQLVLRCKTIEYMRAAVDELMSIEMSTSVAKVTGSGVGVVGSIAAMLGGALCLTGAGAAIGAPMMIIGSGVGVSGGLTVAGSIVVESLLKSDRLKGVNTHLQNDYFRSVKIRILVGRAAKDTDFASKMGFAKTDAVSVVSMIGRAAKLGHGFASLAKVGGIMAARGTATVGFHLAGVVLAGLLIPIDLWQLIESSLKFYRKNISAMVKEMDFFVDELENQVRNLLQERGYVISELSLPADELENTSMCCPSGAREEKPSRTLIVAHLETLNVASNRAVKEYQEAEASNRAVKEYQEAKGTKQAALLALIRAQGITLTKRVYVLMHQEMSDVIPVYIPDSCTTVRKLKQLISYRLAILPKHQTLMIEEGPQILNNSTPLAEYRIRENVTIRIQRVAKNGSRSSNPASITRVSNMSTSERFTSNH